MMDEFRQENTSGYSTTELELINDEWVNIVVEFDLNPGTDEYYAELKKFSDQVSHRV